MVQKTNNELLQLADVTLNIYTHACRHLGSKCLFPHSSCTNVTCCGGLLWLKWYLHTLSHTHTHRLACSQFHRITAYKKHCQGSGKAPRGSVRYILQNTRGLPATITGSYDVNVAKNGLRRCFSSRGKSACTGQRYCGTAVYGKRKSTGFLF